MKTVFVNPTKVERKWHVIDAEGKTVGKVATKAAALLRGKHKTCYTPHQEVGDYVIVINADKVQLTGRKPENKLYYRHSGYPGSLRVENFNKIIRRRPEYPVEHAVRGMLPKNRLGRKLFTNLHVYAGGSHPHRAQKPEPIEL